MRTLISIILLSIPAMAFAAAGFADAYHDHRHWIFPAYAYCLAFGLIVLFGLFILSLIFKAKTQEISETISAFFISHRVLAIIMSGILLAIPLGIIGAVSWEIIWFLSIPIGMGLMIAFPMLIVNRRFREKWLLSSSFGIKWSFMISISAIVASVLFIVLTECDLLPGTDITYFARPDRSHRDFYSPSHPYDSMKEIWAMPLFFISEIVIALILYYLGIFNRYLCRKLSEVRHRKRETFKDVYLGE